MKRSNIFILGFSVFILLIISIIIINKNKYISNIKNIFLYENFNDDLKQISKLKFHVKEGIYYLSKIDGIWTIPQYYNYPVDINKINNLFLEISQLNLVEKKTNDPKYHSKMGVALEKNYNSESKRIEIFKDNENKIYDFIIGQKANINLTKDAKYIRKVEENQVWLFTQTLNIYDEALSWTNTAIFKLGRWRVKEYESIDKVSKKRNFLIFRKDYYDQMYKLKNIPDDYVLLDSYITNSVVSTLEGIEVIDIHEKKDLSKFQEIKEIKVKTFGGLELFINILSQNEKKYLIFDLKSNLNIRKELEDDGPKVIGIPKMKEFKEIEKEVDEYSFLNQWMFEIDEDSTNNLVYNKKDLIKKKTKKLN